MFCFMIFVVIKWSISFYCITHHVLPPAMGRNKIVPVLLWPPDHILLATLCKTRQKVVPPSLILFVGFSSTQSSPVVGNVFQKSLIQIRLFSKEWSESDTKANKRMFICENVVLKLLQNWIWKTTKKIFINGVLFSFQTSQTKKK